MNDGNHFFQSFVPRTRPLESDCTTLVAAVDIGTSKISCLLARLKPRPNANELTRRTHSVRVLAAGHSDSRGIKSGTVSNFNQSEQSVRQALGLAEGKKFEISSALLSVSGGRLASESFSAAVAVTGMVCDHDVTRVLAAASPNPMRNGRFMLHSMPSGYSVGTINGIREPRKMLARQLGINLCVVSVDIRVARDLMLALESCHVKTNQLVASPYAAGLSVLTDDEMELGSAVIDIGAGTTTMAVFSGGNLLYANGFALGGHHITMDLARGADISIADAEFLKKWYGIVDLGDPVSIGDCASGGSVAPKIILRSAALRIMRPRVEEILEMVRDRLATSSFGTLPRPRVVLTGGASQLKGLPEIAARILACPVRVGSPFGVDGLTNQGPALAVATGLLIYPQAAHLEQIVRHKATPRGYFAEVGAWLREGFS